MSSGEISVTTPGTLIGDKYRVERVLGRGGMGIVLAARHIDLGQDVAIKLLLPTADEAESEARFLREGKAAASFSSQHVAKVHDTGRLATGQPYLVMEFLHGRDLKDVVRSDGPQALSVIIPWMLEAIEALSEAHAMKLVHRDIKPSNIFLAETPSGRKIIKILDFGISKQLGSGEADLTSTWAMMGSPVYMAPEQMRSSKNVDHRVDIWSLGTVIFELATGRTPFLGESVTEILGEVLYSEPPVPSSLSTDLPATFDAVVLRCLEKRPEARYASVADLAEDLRAVLAGSPLVVSTPAVPPPSPSGTGPIGPGSATTTIVNPSPTVPDGTEPAAAETGPSPADRPGSLSGSMQTWQDAGPSNQHKRGRVPVVAFGVGVALLGLAGGGYAWFQGAQARAAMGHESGLSLPPKPESESSKGTSAPDVRPSTTSSQDPSSSAVVSSRPASSSSPPRTGSKAPPPPVSATPHSQPAQSLAPETPSPGRAGSSSTGGSIWN